MSDNPYERLRASLQNLLNSEGDGWTLSHYVIVMGLQRMDAEGSIENTVWMTMPAEQADYVTDGLVTAAGDMRSQTDLDNEDD